jgi:hypothetical protein
MLFINISMRLKADRVKERNFFQILMGKKKPGVNRTSNLLIFIYYLSLNIPPPQHLNISPLMVV